MGKDWTGNKRSVWATLGASNHSSGERECMDFYASSPESIDHLAAKFDIPHKIYECACGQGHLSERLIKLGHEVYSTDLVDRGYGIGGVDFLEVNKLPVEGCSILTNPPFKYAEAFIKHGLELVDEGSYVIMLLKTTFLEGQRRYKELYSVTPPHRGIPVRQPHHVRQERRLRGHGEGGRQCGKLCLVRLHSQL